MSEFRKRYCSGVGAWYIRVSTDQQDTQRQHEAIAAWLTRHELIVPGQFQFEDHGLKRDQPEKRPEFMRMLKMAEVGLINWIVSDSQDRFGTKDKYQFMSFMHDLEFPTESGRSAKRVIVHARSVRNVEEVSETSPS